MTTQLQLDLDRADQQADNCDRAMRQKGVPPIQRAVLILLLTHPRSASDGERRALTLALRPAAEWLRTNVACVRGLTCDHTAVRKAFQAWIDRGVAAVTQNGTRRTLWLSIDKLRDWHDSQPDEDEEPLFGALTPLTAGDCCRPLVTGGDSQKMKEEEIVFFSKTQNPFSSSSSSAPEGHQRSTAITASHQAVNEITELLRSLPPLPDDLFAARTDRALRDAVLRFWSEHDLKVMLGEQSKPVGQTLIGLLSLARAKNSPAAFYAACLRSGVRDHVTRDGAAILRSLDQPAGIIIHSGSGT